MGALCSCCCDSHDAQEITEKYGRWKPPSEEAAKSATKFFASHHHTFTVIGTRTEDLGEFGEGHTLYFYFLKWFSLLFGLLFLISGLPSIIVNILGDYYEDLDWPLTTLGNFGTLREVNSTALLNSTIGAEESELERMIVDIFRNDTAGEHKHLLGSSAIRKDHAIVFTSVMDFLAVLIYIAATVIMIRMQNKVAKQVNMSTVTIADYSIRVNALPHDAKSEEVKEFFEKWGEVVAVELVKTDCELVDCAKKKREATEQLETATAEAQKAVADGKTRVSARLVARIEALNAQLETFNERATALFEARSSAKVVCAFVTFKEEDQKIAVLESYPNSFGRQLFMRKWKRFRGEYRLKIRNAPEPSDIFWENIQFNQFNRLRRKGLTTFIKYTALLIGFILMNLATSMRRNASQNTLDRELCDAVCDYHDANGNVNLTDTMRDRYFSCWKASADEGNCTATERSCYPCYCEETVINIAGGADLNNPETDYCQDYLSRFALQTASEVLAVSGVLIINMTLTALAVRLSRFERHHTRISEERSLAHKLFLSQFLNTVISYLMATTLIPRLANIAKESGLGKLIFVGIYFDTTPTWYDEVGRSLTITMVIQSVLRLVAVLVQYVTFKWQYWRRSASITQSQMNKAFLGPEFELAPRYGQLLTLIFVSMLFGGGIPILYLVAALSFMLQYWAEKAELIKLSRRPSAYGPDLADMVAGLIPYAALWHMAFSMWSFSYFKTERSPLVNKSSYEHVEWFVKIIYWVLAVDESEAIETASRVLQKNAAHHFVGVIVLAVIIILKVTMSTWLATVRQVAAFLGIIKDSDLDSSLTTGYPPFPIAVRSRLLVGPTSYGIKSNPKYMYALAAHGWYTMDRQSNSAESPKIKSELDAIPEASGSV